MKKIGKNNVWIIIPGLNEEKYIATVLKKVQNYTKNIIVVDDGSTDKMPDIARKYTDHVLSHSVNF
jgi:glycosyltransferase involved in cell wall biosynthesis